MIPDRVTRTFQSLWYWLVPGFLQQGDGERVQQVIGLVHDAFVERCRQTAVLDCPSYAPADQLPVLGVDRGIRRGQFEPEASYRQRLLRWRWPRGHRIRGNAIALLEQVQAAVRGTSWTTIDQRGTRFDYGSDSATLGVTWDWDGAALLPNWGRYWIVIESTGAPWPSFADGAWGDTVLGDESTCLAGSGVTPGELDAVKQLTKPGNLSWTPAGRRAIYLTLYFSGDPFPAPTGDWDEWANRDPSYRYVPLHASLS